MTPTPKECECRDWEDGGPVDMSQCPVHGEKPPKEGPPNVDVPLEDQTKESLIAYIKSLEKQGDDDQKRRAAESKALEVAALVLLLDNEQELVLTDDQGSNVPLCGSPLEMKARAIFEEIGWDKYREIISRPNIKERP